MTFDGYTAALAFAAASNKDIDDANKKKIMLVAGMATGTGLSKLIAPFLMIQQAEEIRDKEKEIAANRLLLASKQGGTK